MTVWVMFAAGLAGGSLASFHAGIAAHRRRLRQVARSVPGDQVAVATLERLLRDTRTLPDL